MNTQSLGFIRFRVPADPGRDLRFTSRLKAGGGGAGVKRYPCDPGVVWVGLKASDSGLPSQVYDFRNQVSFILIILAFHASRYPLGERSISGWS
jgi:hypothetical protein